MEIPLFSSFKQTAASTPAQTGAWVIDAAAARANRANYWSPHNSHNDVGLRPVFYYISQPISGRCRFFCGVFADEKRIFFEIITDWHLLSGPEPNGRWRASQFRPNARLVSRWRLISGQTVVIVVHEAHSIRIYISASRGSDFSYVTSAARVWGRAWLCSFCTLLNHTAYAICAVFITDKRGLTATTWRDVSTHGLRSAWVALNKRWQLLPILFRSNTIYSSHRLKRSASWWKPKCDINICGMCVIYCAAPRRLFGYK